MTHRPTLRALQSACVAIPLIILGAGLVARGAPALAQGGTMDAAAHKQMMNDASDAQENFRFALTDKDQKAAIQALVALERFMEQTETYWTAKKMADAVKLAKDARAQASQALAAAKTSNMKAAQESFDAMGATCNACHDLQLEKR